MKISENDNILVISHGFRLTSGGPAQDIRDYLRGKVSHLDYIDHPFPIANYKETHFFSFIKGQLISTRKSYPYANVEFIRYIQQFFVTFCFLLFNKTKYDICFALDNHSTVSVWLFRKVGRIRKLVYYSIDFIPKRFNNSILNRLYHMGDRLACQLSDINWVVAKHAIQARRNNGANLKELSPFVEVPMGFHRDDVREIPIDRIDPYNLIYMGTILEKQGLQLVIEGLPKIIERLPKVKLTIIGTGIYENELKKLVAHYRIGSKVKFKGFISSAIQMYELLSEAGVGLAPYKPTPDSFSYFADPSKIKIYLGCGLPIITTNVTEFSKMVKKYKAGKIIDYTVESLVGSVINLLKNRQTYIAYRKAAKTLSTKYDTANILKKAIKNL